MRIWTLCYITTDMSLEDVYHETEILTDKGLQLRLKEALLNEQLNEGTIKHYGFKEDEDTEFYDADYIADVFRYDGYECDSEELKHCEI